MSYHKHVTSSKHRPSFSDDTYISETSSDDEIESVISDTSTVYSSNASSVITISNNDPSSLSTSIVSESDEIIKKKPSPPFKGLTKCRRKKKRQPTFEEFVKEQQMKLQRKKEIRELSERKTDLNEQSYNLKDIGSLSESDVGESGNAEEIGIHHHHHHYHSGNSSSKSNTDSVNINNTVQQMKIPASNMVEMNQTSSSAPQAFQSSGVDTVPVHNTSMRLSTGSMFGGSLLGSSSFVISTNNSKAVLSALKSLQNKIKSLEDEIENYRKKLEEEKRSKVEIKYELEQANLKLKHDIEREKHLNATMKHDFEQQIEQLRQQHEKAIYELQLSSEKTKTAYEQQVKALEEKNKEYQTLYSQAQNKIDELQRNIIKAIKRKEKAETHSKELDKALQEMVTLHKAFARQTASQQQESIANKGSQNSARDSEDGNELSNSKRKKTTKSTKKKSKDKSSGKKRILLSRSLSGKRSSSRDRSRSAERYRNNSPHFSASYNSQHSFHTKHTAPNLLRHSGNLQERYKKASMMDNVPFIAPGTENTFNVNSLVQKNLNIGIENEKKKSEEPYQYYGANQLDSLHAEMLKEIDDINSSEELDEVLKILEDEYRQLNDKYNALLPSASNDNNESELKKASSQNTNLEIKTEEMRKIIAEMEKKGKIISFLKQYRTKVADQIREATSPPRIRGAEKRVKALRLLNELRALTS